MPNILTALAQSSAILLFFSVEIWVTDALVSLLRSDFPIKGPLTSGSRGQAIISFGLTASATV